MNIYADVIERPKNRAKDVANFIHSGRRVVEQQKRCLEELVESINENFHTSCTLIMNCTGRVVVCGIGKSGHIGKKIAATLASTGTPAFFVHPSEASHGDMGMITSDDVVIAISHSGSTDEIIKLLPLLKRLCVPVISITGNTSSPLANAADINLSTKVQKEACPLNLAPTSSTTAALVLGDALAIALLEARGFTREDFALAHPGGRLGRTLLLKVKDIMYSGDNIPLVGENATLSQALIEMSKKGLGMTGICNDNHQLIGIFTDGDLRRALDKNVQPNNVLIKDIMTKKFTTISAETLASEALGIMQKKKINSFICIDENKRPVGAFNVHNLLRASVV